jgi:hypothetical protein
VLEYESSRDLPGVAIQCQPEPDRSMTDAK